MHPSSDTAHQQPDSKLAAHSTHRSSCRTLVAATAVIIALIAGSTFWLQSPEMPGATASSSPAPR